MAGLIDCDIHPAVPSQEALLPYLPEPWPETVVVRGIQDLDPISYPNNAPITARPDWRPETERPASRLEMVRRELLDPWNTSIAICNCLYAVQLLYNLDMACAYARAVNEWIAKEWLDKEPRLRSSIVIPLLNPEKAVEEIERCASDDRFVQVLLPVFADAPLGQRQYWPIYEAAERHGLAIGIHAGSSYRHPVTSVGWPTYLVEDYVAQAQGFQTQVASFICEGVFQKFPRLRLVLIESGFTWLPACIWRLDKYWRGLRSEIPWVDRSPVEIAREHIRLTLQPADCPPKPGQFEQLLDHMGSDRLLLFSTDYPHWQFDRLEAIPQGMSPDLVRKMQFDNPMETYPRLRGLQ